MEIDPTASLYPVRRNDRYTVKRAISDEYDATTYNNFYEFGSHKSIYRAAEALKTRPWTINIDAFGILERRLLPNIFFGVALHRVLHRAPCYPARSFKMLHFVERRRRSEYDLFAKLYSDMHHTFHP